MYNRIDLVEQGSALTVRRRKRFNIVFDPFLFFILLIITCIILTITIYYLVIVIPPIVYNINKLISTIPDELQFYHTLFQEHNRTLTEIEINVSKYITLSEIIVNNITLSKVSDIIVNMDGITSTLNITGIQNNINDIAATLNRVIPHHQIQNG